MASDEKPEPSSEETQEAAPAIDGAKDEASPSEPPVEHGHGNGHDHQGGASHAEAHAGAQSHDHGLAHTTPVSLLFGILGVLLVLTIATVAVTSVDLGAQGNLVVAMVIATIKAGLVVTFFMHLLWDKKFHLVLFLTSILFVILFLSMTTADRGEYQHLVDEYRAAQLAK